MKPKKQKTSPKDPLKLIEQLYKAVFSTEDRLDGVEKQLKEIQVVLVEILKHHKGVLDFENRTIKPEKP